MSFEERYIRVCCRRAHRWLVNAGKHRHNPPGHIREKLQVYNQTLEAYKKAHAAKGSQVVT